MKANSRRNFIQNSFKASIGIVIGTPLILNVTDAMASQAPFKFSQVPLGYPYNAFEPYVDALTTEIHYTKHHATYVKNVNDAIAAEKIAFTSVKEFFDNASNLSAKARNNGGGSWNHNLFFETLKPGVSAGPEGKIKEAIDAAFGSTDKFKEQFSQAAATRFGSGWAWLINDKGILKITSTANQDNPLFDNAEIKGTPLLALDVWEHAYYLKYQNKRADYISNFWNIVNWDKVASRLI